MKLRMEFEEGDVRSMVSSYFEKNGFKVKNLEELCEMFSSAFPEGISVDVETVEVPVIAVKEETPIRAEAIEEDEAAPEPVKTKKTPSKKVTANPRLSASDIMDPSAEFHAPSRDELLAQRDLEISHILKRSEELKERD